jgi:hypothetical protein
MSFCIVNTLLPPPVSGVGYRDYDAGSETGCGRDIRKSPDRPEEDDSVEEGVCGTRSSHGLVSSRRS